MARTNMRLPTDLYKYISDAAHKSSRSMNYEIVVRLESSVDVDRIIKMERPEDILEAVAKLRKRLVELRLERE